MIEHGVLPYLLAMVLLGVGVYAIACKKNLIKVIVGVIVIEYAVNLFLLLQGYRTGGSAPILTKGAVQGQPMEQALQRFASGSVDPLPQAMILTSIVIGLGVVALMVAIALRIHEKYGTFDLSQIRKLKG